MRGVVSWMTAQREEMSGSSSSNLIHLRAVTLSLETRNNFSASASPGTCNQREGISWLAQAELGASRLASCHVILNVSRGGWD